jgi:hypothetical protein
LQLQVRFEEASKARIFQIVESSAKDAGFSCTEHSSIIGKRMMLVNCKKESATGGRGHGLVASSDEGSGQLLISGYFGDDRKAIESLLEAIRQALTAQNSPRSGRSTSGQMALED